MMRSKTQMFKSGGQTWVTGKNKGYHFRLKTELRNNTIWQLRNVFTFILSVSTANRWSAVIFELWRPSRLSPWPSCFISTLPLSHCFANTIQLAQLCAPKINLVYKSLVWKMLLPWPRMSLFHSVCSQPGSCFWNWSLFQPLRFSATRIISRIRSFLSAAELHLFHPPWLRLNGQILYLAFIGAPNALSYNKPRSSGFFGPSFQTYSHGCIWMCRCSEADYRSRGLNHQPRDW